MLMSVYQDPQEVCPARFLAKIQGNQVSVLGFITSSHKFTKTKLKKNLCKITLPLSKIDSSDAFTWTRH